MRFSFQKTVSLTLVCLSFRCLPGQVAATAENAPISLQEAILRAQANEPSYASAVAGSRTANLDRSIAQSALLPSIDFHNQGLYTQPSLRAGQTSSQSSPRFIANNAVREYTSQGVVNETIGLNSIADLRRANATALKAAAEQEIARRGLVVTVTELYFGVIGSDHRAAIAEQAHREAAEFLSLTEKREAGREAAHADVVKAQLEEQRSNRELLNARLNSEKAHLELGILLFSDPRTPYTLVDTGNPAPLASRADVEAKASKNNPELKAALAVMRACDADVLSARAAYLPSIGLNYIYGIDAPQFAVNGPDHTSNLGYSASVTVDLPVWDWLATQHKIKQSEIRRDAVRVAMNATQSRLIARLNESYSEAAAARDQLASLDESVATAAESLRLTKLRYSEGEATVLEVVDAQTAFVSMENAREDGRARYQAARADLQTLTGTM
ncbi:MAG: TolC family protein [Terracidiphilus sp.]